MGWKPARKNHFPPPKDLPEYATRPLPPRPSSSSSSIYDSDQGSQPLTQHRLFKGAQEDSRLSTNFAGSIDESALKMVRPPSIVTSLPEPQGQGEIASPQPLHPEHKVLKLKIDEDSQVSPILTPPSGKNSHYQYSVSPLSPDGSVHSFETAVSELDSSSSLRPDSWLKEKNPIGTDGRRPSRTDNTADQGALGFRPLALQTESLHPRLQKINLRYSDPGSPVNGTIRPKDAGESGPDIGTSARFSQGQTADAHPTATLPRQAKQAHHESWCQSPVEMELAANGRKIAFSSGDIDGFSHRTAGPSQRNAPPPLKLSERPLAETYIKTPFPPRTNSEYSQKSVFEEDDDSHKKHNRRVSSISGFAKSLRPTSLHRSESNSTVQSEASRTGEQTSRASPVPIVKNILSKAKSGLKIGSDEAKKERKRELLKRQIKVGTVEE